MRPSIPLGSSPPSAISAAVLIAPSALAASQQELLETASRHHLTVGQVDYAQEAHAAGRFSQASMNLPLTGRYVDIRAFLASALANQPALSFRHLAIQRNTPTDLNSHAYGNVDRAVPARGAGPMKTRQVLSAATALALMIAFSAEKSGAVGTTLGLGPAARKPQSNDSRPAAYRQGAGDCHRFDSRSVFRPRTCPGGDRRAISRQVGELPRRQPRPFPASGLSESSRTTMAGRFSSASRENRDRSGWCARASPSMSIFTSASCHRRH